MLSFNPRKEKKKRSELLLCMSSRWKGSWLQNWEQTDTWGSFSWRHWRSPQHMNTFIAMGGLTGCASLRAGLSLFHFHGWADHLQLHKNSWAYNGTLLPYLKMSRCLHHCINACCLQHRICIFSQWFSTSPISSCLPSNPQAPAAWKGMQRVRQCSVLYPGLKVNFHLPYLLTFLIGLT